MLFGKRRSQKRKVYGFLCDRSLPIIIKIQSEQLGVREYSICEHALQLGCQAIEEVLKNEKQRQELRKHLINDHQILPKLDPGDENERRILAEAKNIESERQKLEEIENELILISRQDGITPEMIGDSVRALVELCLKEGESPIFIIRFLREVAEICYREDISVELLFAATTSFGHMWKKWLRERGIEMPR